MHKGGLVWVHCVWALNEVVEVWGKVYNNVFRGIMTKLKGHGMSVRVDVCVYIGLGMQVVV